jgi:DNA invertase Pin-like site-specific DNA recombinase
VEKPCAKAASPAIAKPRFSGSAALCEKRVVLSYAGFREACCHLFASFDGRSAHIEPGSRVAASCRTGGREVVKAYRDHGISGAKGRDKRPAFDAMCRDASRREFDVVMAWSVDRLGRSLQDLVNFLSELHALKVDLFLKTQGIDTTTPGGKAMFGMLSVFADFERSIIQERVRAGLVRARREGKRLGRPSISADVEQQILAALKAGMSIRKTAEEFGVNPSTVQRVKRPFDGASAAA